MKRVVRPLVPFLLLFSLATVAMVLVGAPQNTRRGGPPRKPPDVTANMKPRSVFGAFYLVGDGFNSTLGLNNSTQFPLTVYPTLYSPSGVRMPMAAVTVDPHQHIQVDMAAWVSQLADEFRSGSLQLDYDSFLNAIGAQVLVTDESRSLSMDVPIRGRHEHRSSRLEAVWWAYHRDSGMNVVVLNTTDSPVTAAMNITASDGSQIKSLPIPLGPHHSREINLRAIVTREHGTVGGVSIQHDGKPGAVMAEGFVTLGSKGFSSNIRFHDPATFGGNALHGAGVYLPEDSSSFEGHLMLRNVSSEVVTAHPVLQHGDQEIELGELILDPGASKRVTAHMSLTEGQGQGTAIEVSYTGPPGSLIGHWFSVDEAGDMVVETPLRNPGPATASSGSHPFKLADDFESVLFVKNTAVERSSFFGVIFFRDDRYLVGIVDVEPGKTVAINIRELRDQQVPDGLGKLLPRDLEEGQVQWLHRSGPKMAGRMRILSRSRRISTNMSCGWCSCNPRDVWFRLDPNSKSAQVGDVVQEKVYETNCDCAFNCFENPIPTNPGGYAWYSNNPFVASPTGPGQVTCWWQGSAVITAEQWVDLYEPGVSECESGPCEEVCQSVCDGPCPRFADAFYDVSAPPPPPTVTFGSLAAVGVSYTASVQVTINPPTSVTLTLAPTTGTGAAVFAANNSASLTINSSQSVSIRGTTVSSTANNLRLANSVTSSTRDFTVVQVVLTLRTSGAVSLDNQARAEYFNRMGTFNLGTIQSTGTLSPHWGTAVEIVGTILPSNFPAATTIRREVIAFRVFDNMTQVQSGGPADDTSAPAGRDDDPQSGNSGGKVYDIDAPGFSLSGYPVGTIIRFRANFRQWAEVGGFRVSGDLLWFSRISVRQTSTGSDLPGDLAGDNTAGMPATSLTWNFQ